MKIAVISHNRYLDNEAEIVNQLFEAGLDYFHIKKNKRNTRKLKRLLDSINPDFYNRISLHRNFSIAAKYKLQGAHFTNKHREKYAKTFLEKRWLRICHKKIRFTMSYHSLESLSEDTTDYDYCFLSPIFGSTTKKYQPGFNQRTLSNVLRKTDKQTFALGGVNLDNIESAKKIGFDGVALSTFLWDSDQPVTNFKKAREIADSL